MSNDDTFPKKWDKVLDDLSDNFKEKAESFSADELRKCIVDCNKSISISEKDMEADDDLTTAKANVKSLSEPYKVDIKVAQAKSRYCVFLLKQRGQ